MKVLLVSTYSNGGGAVAARREATALVAAGHEVHHAVLSLNPNMPIGDGNVVPKWRPLMEGEEAAKYLDQQRQQREGLFTGSETLVSNTFISAWIVQADTDFTLFKMAAELFDVVHFHWTTDVLSSRVLQLLNSLPVPVVLTAHDMNFFTGACHYSAGCAEYRQECKSCHLVTGKAVQVSQSLSEKIQAFENVGAHFLFPSAWLYECYLSSKLGQTLGHESATLLANCIDRQIYQPVTDDARQLLRAELGFDDNDILLVSGAENNNEIRKGFYFVEGALRSLSSSYEGQKQVVLLTFGHGELTEEVYSSRVKHRHLGWLVEPKVRSLLQAADLLIFSSIEENLANILVESICCGCPAVAFDIGGNSDVIVDKVCGQLISEVDQDEYSKAVRFWVECLEREAAEVRARLQGYLAASPEWLGLEEHSAQLVEVYLARINSKLGIY